MKNIVYIALALLSSFCLYSCGKPVYLAGDRNDTPADSITSDHRPSW